MSSLGLIFAVALLLGLLLAAIRIQARDASRPKKELRLRTRFDRDSSAPALQVSAEEKSAIPCEPTLKLPRKKPNA